MQGQLNATILNDLPLMQIDDEESDNLQGKFPSKQKKNLQGKRNDSTCNEDLFFFFKFLRKLSLI